MDKSIILLYAVSFLVVATATTVIPAQRRLKRNRTKWFRVICEDWLIELNRIASDPSCNTTGSAFSPAKYYPLEKRSDAGWVVCYPLKKHYPDLGLITEVNMIILVPSFNPGKQEIIDTIFLDLSHPGQQWWDSTCRSSTFYKVIQCIAHTHCRERKFAFAPPIGNTTLVPANQ